MVRSTLYYNRRIGPKADFISKGRVYGRRYHHGLDMLDTQQVKEHLIKVPNPTRTMLSNVIVRYKHSHIFDLTYSEMHTQ